MNEVNEVSFFTNCSRNIAQLLGLEQTSQADEVSLLNLKLDLHQMLNTATVRANVNRARGCRPF